MREVRIRRETNGWFTVERITWVDIHDHVKIKPSYHMNFGSALLAVVKWIWWDK